MRLTAIQIKKRDAKRDIDAELLQSIREMRAGKGKVVAKMVVPRIALLIQ